jgi:site-specific DNA recombinase
MIAAIYARKSNKEHDKATPELRQQRARAHDVHGQSVNGQIDEARRFIQRQGWLLDDAHIYADDGKSGALFLGRPAFQHMLADAEAGAFNAVVLFDLDRFGRHAEETMKALGKLADVDVDVYDCSTGQKVDLESFEGRISASLRAEFAQQFRDQIRKHTRRAMQKKAREGWHTHGKVFGYDVQRVAKGQSTLVVNKPEARVVVDIYTRFANGEGARTIAAALNHKRVPKPRAQQGRRDGWSASTIRAVLKRALYRGEIVYGRTMKAYNRELRRVRRGTSREKGQIPMPDDTWIRTPAPHLRIIDEELATRVDTRLEDRRSRYLAAIQRNATTAPWKAHGRYLLSGGMLLCPTCGGNFEVRKYPFRGKGPAPVYMCATRRRKPGICTNTLALPLAATDDAVLDIIEGEVLGTRYITELLALVDRGEADNTAHLEADRDRLERELKNLAEAIALGTITTAEAAASVKPRRDELLRVEAKLRKPRVVPPDMEKLRAALEQRATEWKKELRAEPAIARLVLRRLVGPLTLWDESTRPGFVKWEATPTTGLLEGMGPTLLDTSPAGFEPALPA